MTMGIEMGGLERNLLPMISFVLSCEIIILEDLLPPP